MASCVPPVLHPSASGVGGSGGSAVVICRAGVVVRGLTCTVLGCVALYAPGDCDQQESEAPAGAPPGGLVSEGQESLKRRIDRHRRGG